MGLEWARLRRHTIWSGDGIPHAGGQPVLLVPGFLAGDDTLGTMTHWLRRTGHRTRKAGMRLNVDCSESALERLVERVEAMCETHGEKVAVIGQSRGGSLARVLAVRRPELVSGIVTLGTPLTNSFVIHPLVNLHVLAVGALGTLGVRGLFGRGCRTGDCCTGYWADLEGPFPKGVGFLSIYSRTDGIVAWESCLDPAAEHVEVRSSHIGMGLNPDAYAATAAALERFRTPNRRSKRAPAGKRAKPAASRSAATGRGRAAA